MKLCNTYNCLVKVTVGKTKIEAEKKTKSTILSKQRREFLNLMSILAMRRRLWDNLKRNKNKKNKFISKVKIRIFVY